eukprot:Colp12_sorted_trinity150504_noHs@1502
MAAKHLQSERTLIDDDVTFLPIPEGQTPYPPLKPDDHIVFEQPVEVPEYLLAQALKRGHEVIEQVSQSQESLDYDFGVVDAVQNWPKAEPDERIVHMEQNSNHCNGVDENKTKTEDANKVFDAEGQLLNEAKRKIMLLESSMNFVQSQHREVLQSLHEEVERLKEQNQHLNFSLVMGKNGTYPTARAEESDVRDDTCQTEPGLERGVKTMEGIKIEGGSEIEGSGYHEEPQRRPPAPYQTSG